MLETKETNGTDSKRIDSPSSVHRLVGHQFEMAEASRNLRRSKADARRGVRQAASGHRYDEQQTRLVSIVLAGRRMTLPCRKDQAADGCHPVAVWVSVRKGWVLVVSQVA